MILVWDGLRKRKTHAHYNFLSAEISKPVGQGSEYIWTEMTG